MKLFTQTSQQNAAPEILCQYLSLERSALEKCLFFDIETTGFSADRCLCYLIGAAYRNKKTWEIRQWLAENPKEEKEVLSSFFDFASSYSRLIHFNGNQFDIPFLAKRASHWELPFPLEHLDSFDLFKKVSPFKKILGLPHCRQKDIENFLKIHREDLYTGGQLIPVYEAYVKTENASSKELENVLLLHNTEDVKGLLEILPILSYPNLFANSPQNIELSQETSASLLLKMTLPSPLPIPLQFENAGISFSGKGEAGLLEVPLYKGELKHFYPDYRDYYYFEKEDMAIHKSVAIYSEKASRQKATPETAYIKKSGVFLPYPEKSPQSAPRKVLLFRESHDSKNAYFLFQESFLKDQEALSLYALQALRMCGLPSI
ncbi:MAG: ribonuclease H-like domain-containing protein [Lachnospiraceae bacterium]|nr:ribonuclease H-like domain-containing protein [Lachnospiraceae bacterium]